MGEHLTSSVVRDAAWKVHFSLAPSRVLNCELHHWGGGGEQEEAKWAADRIFRIEGIWSLLTVMLWTPSSSPCMSCRRYLACGFLHWLMGTPSAPHHTHTHTYTLCGWLFMWTLDSSKSELWQMSSGHTQKASQNIRTRERPQTWTTVQGKQKAGCQHSACYVTGSRKGIPA